MFSNRYIFIYSTILVVCSAAILTLAAVGLKPLQDKNIRVEKMQLLLSSVGIESNTDNAEELFNQYFVEELAVNAKGEVIGLYKNQKQVEGKVRPFEINTQEQLNLYKADKPEACLPVYICDKDGKKFFVVPVYGSGLWGPLWGNIAFENDLNTIFGVNFGHKGETPGLGAEIAALPFQKQFIGKQIFDKGEFVSVSAIKMADKANPHQVDAISGGTITTNGLSDMLRDCLKFFVPFFQSTQSQVEASNNTDKI